MDSSGPKAVQRAAPPAREAGDGSPDALPSAPKPAVGERSGDTVDDTLRAPVPASDSTSSPDSSSDWVGLYRLRRRLGEGGMGEVWLAEQKHPVRRRVAIKLIKAGMDTNEVVARFESERQALALMDHPAIAKVFDGGTTPQGLPYFVMEYVSGIPLTDYCDRHKLSTQARLELFIRICEGVQHAHQKAIIHRDLKPSNILVCEVDGKPVPRIIDFGIAKAISQRLTADTMYYAGGRDSGHARVHEPGTGGFGGRGRRHAHRRVFAGGDSV